MWMRYNIKLVTCLTFNTHSNTHLLRIRFDNIFFNGHIVPLLLPDQRVCRLVDQYYFLQIIWPTIYDSLQIIRQLLRLLHFYPIKVCHHSGEYHRRAPWMSGRKTSVWRRFYRLSDEHSQACHDANRKLWVKCFIGNPVGIFLYLHELELMSPIS